MLRLLLFWCWLGLLLSPGLRAQTFDPRTAVPPDSLHSRLNLTGLQPDSLRRRFDEERILLGLKNYTRRKTLVGRAASALFNFTQRQEERAGLDAVLLDRQFDQHNYKVVRRVLIRPYDAFGYSLSDSTRRPHTFWENAGNAIHIRTARSRIRQVLLFRPGQPLPPQALAESERLLRQTGEILDARVLVNEATTTRDSVDIEVLTTDVFSLTGGFELGGPQSGVISAGDQNFLGLGHQIDNRYEYGRSQPQPWSYEGRYQVPFRNFFLGEARYRNEYQLRSGGASLRRDFYSVYTKYAGAASVDFYDQQITLVPTPPGEEPVYHPLRYSTQDLWVGRAFRLRSYDLGYENPGRVILAARFNHSNYAVAPTPDYRTTTLVLGTLGYSVRRYYKDRYLFGFGRTEDVPTGTLLGLTTGLDLNSEVPRRYLAARAAVAGYSPRHGYLYGGAELGSFQRTSGEKKGLWEQGLLSSQTLYFTRLYHTGNYQWRHLLDTRATVGFNRRPGELLLSGVSGDHGLRGFQPAQPLLITSRFTLNYEATVYTPVSFLGFRLAGVLFADAAWTSERPGGGTPFTDSPYTGFGLGLRFRNEFTALRTFQLLLGFYPRGQTSPNGFRLFESARDYYDFSDFSFSQPGVVQYQ